MGSKIEWTDETWNPVTGCTKVSAGCKNCYAERWARRRMTPEWKGTRKFSDVVCHEERLGIPGDWTRPRQIFVCSMSDLFHEDVPTEFIRRVFRMMFLTSRHTYQVLTKRTRRARHLLNDWLGEWSGLGGPGPNIHIGASVENQQTLLERVPDLLATPAARRFLSIEPLLDEIELLYPKAFWPDGPPMCCDLFDCGCQGRPVDPPFIWGPEGGIHHVIVGGESGPGARPCDVGWIRRIIQDCREAHVACFVKQLGAHPYEAHGEMDYCCEDCDKHPGKHPLGRLDPDGITRDIRHPKAGDPAEWPADLRVREEMST